MTFRRILVATDFSAGAERAIRTGRRFLEPGGELRLVHVVPYPVITTETGAAALIADAKWLDKAEVDLSRVAASHGASWVVRQGHPPAEISEEASAFHADLVVVGSRGLSKTKRLFLGSVARAVVRRSPVSVLVARSDVGAERGPIVVATDLYAPSTEAARLTRTLIEDGTPLHIVHAVDPAMWAAVTAPPSNRRYARYAWIESSVKASLHAFNESILGGRATEHVAPGRPVPTLLRFIAGARPSLLVVGTHGAGAFERAVFGSVAERLVEAAPCDVLVVKPSAAPMTYHPSAVAAVAR